MPGFVGQATFHKGDDRHYYYGGRLLLGVIFFSSLEKRRGKNEFFMFAIATRKSFAELGIDTIKTQRRTIVPLVVSNER